MNKQGEFPRFGCGDPDCRVCGENGLREGLGGIFIGTSDEFPDAFEEIFKNKNPLNTEQLAAFLAGPLAGKLKDLLSDITGRGRSYIPPFKEDDSLPAFVNEAWKGVHRGSR